MSDTPTVENETPTWPSNDGPYDRPTQPQSAAPYDRPTQPQSAAAYNAPGQPQPNGAYNAPPTGRRPRSALPPRTRIMLNVAHLIALIVSIIEAFLVLRIILMLLAANPDAPFTSWIYSWTAPLVAPFWGIFPNAATRGHVLDAAAIVAVIVYAIFGGLVEGIAQWLAQA